MPVLVAMFYFVNRHYKRVADVLQLRDVEELRQSERGIRGRGPDDGRHLRRSGQLAHRPGSRARAGALTRRRARGDYQQRSGARPSVCRPRGASWASRCPLKWSTLPTGNSSRPPWPTSALSTPARSTPSPWWCRSWWSSIGGKRLLHNQDALRLKGSLLREPWVVVMSIPLHVAAAPAEGPARGSQDSAGRTGRPAAEAPRQVATRPGSVRAAVVSFFFCGASMRSR